MKSYLLFAVVLVLSSAPVRSVTPVAPFLAAKPAACDTASNVSSSARAPRPAFFGETGAGVPQPVFDTGCTAQFDCPLPLGNHTTISCSGAASCSVGTYWITCDGTTTYCGCVGCGFCYCDCWDGGGTAINCFHECRYDC